jgi:hypothetical protein
MAQHRGVAIVEAGRVARRPRLHLSRSQRVLLDTRDRLGQHRPNHDNELLALYSRPLSSDEQRHTDAATAEALRTELRRAQRIRARLARQGWWN